MLAEIPLPEPRTPVYSVDIGHLDGLVDTVLSHFIPVIKQTNLPHQFDLMYCLANTAVRGTCNCGWRGLAYRPESGDPVVLLDQALNEYRLHLPDHRPELA